MSKAFINGIGCISAQPISESIFGDSFEVKNNVSIFPSIAPEYKDFIPPATARRMSKGVKNSIVAANLAMSEAGISMPDAIITGTGLGCIEDSGKFLQAILDNNEQFLTPTSFIQSTHNTVAAQIALGIQCKADNFTYVNGVSSFESALMDGIMRIGAGENSILVGGIDELNAKTINLYTLVGRIKNLEVAESDGVVYGEAAVFFVLQDKVTSSSYACVEDVEMNVELEIDELNEKITSFLTRNNLTWKEIDVLVLGYNGDYRYDGYYDHLTKGIFVDTPQVIYKHLCGEFNTASAFGLYATANLVAIQRIPKIMMKNDRKPKEIRYVLLYNQYEGTDHSFTLISSCRSTS